MTRVSSFSKTAAVENMVSVLPCSCLFLLPIFCFFHYIESAATFGFTNEADRDALLAIKLKISNPFGVLNSWNSTLHFCDWQGVVCGRRHQRVTALNVSSLSLEGSLAPHVGNLTFLRAIDLSNNSFHGTIPNEVSRLSRLQILYLANNSFQGEVPANLTHCSNLRAIDLNGNKLEGNIPFEFGSLSKLYKLQIAMNNLTGSIPPSLGNLSGLRLLSLMSNNLGGNIPVEFGQLSNLGFLQLSSNKLSGMVPKQLYNITSMYHFAIADNHLHGSLPPDLGLTLPNLRMIYLGMNQFTGPVPASIANASGLIQIDMGINFLTGPMPKNLGRLENLQAINFGVNPLGDEIGNHYSFLTSLTNCTSLSMMWFYQNNLKGVLPNSIADLSSNVVTLRLETNYISGSIPSGIGNLVSLEYLSIFENMLTGSIPESIGKLSKLQEFYIYLNQISGKIPSSLGNMTKLRRLHLASNSLEGSIPVSLGSCTSLEALDLSHNQLHGQIPVEVIGLPSFRILGLASNNLTGPLPPDVGNMKNLYGLDVSENKLSGDIPSTLENCIMVGILLLGGNFFEQSLPSSLGKLRNLETLNLSRNNLSGKIPQYLVELPFLDSLDLSNNDFEGEVPTEGVFGNLSAFSVAGNNKLCGGVKELQLPPCPTKFSNKNAKHFPHKVLILVLSISLPIASLVCLFAIVHRIRRSKRTPSIIPPLENQLPMLSYGELLHATDGFSSTNLIGEGRYSSVYKGILTSGKETVAVKVLNLHLRGANKTFIAECETLRNIRHRNLVKVITSCSSIDFKGNDFKALVFDFMPNGSLESWLYPSGTQVQESRKLNLVQRLNIAIDVASALDYLHNHCDTPIIHCDLKPSNILLDNDLTAHVSDFGLARILLPASANSVQAHTSSSGIRGTIGYIAPESGVGDGVSTQSDVYSFGILLMEMFTGKKPTDNMFSDNFTLHAFVKMALPDHVMEIVDPLVLLEGAPESSSTGQSSRGNTETMECLASILNIGVICSANLPSERKHSRDVLMELHAIKNMHHRNRRERHREW